MKHIKRAAVAFAVAVTTLFFVAPVALASAPPPVNADTKDPSTFTLTAPVLTLVVSLLIPVINGILTKATTNAGVKAIGTIIMNAIWALIANGMLSDGSGAWSTETLYTALIGCIISVVSYVGVYKPMTITSNQGGKLANVGVRDKNAT